MLACVDKKDKATTSSAVLQLQLCGAHGTCLASVCLLSLSFVEFVKDAGRLVASRELHVFTTFARRFYWSDLNIWPEDLAPGSVVLLSGQDDLMDAAEVKDMLDVAGHVKVRTGQGDARQGRCWDQPDGGRRAACAAGHWRRPDGRHWQIYFDSRCLNNLLRLLSLLISAAEGQQ
jgi:hypothetical protein